MVRGVYDEAGDTDERYKQEGGWQTDKQSTANRSIILRYRLKIPNAPRQ